MGSSNILDNCYTAYINLDTRVDRNDHMVSELNRVGISYKRQPAFLPADVQKVEPNDKLQVMLKRTPGAVGCYYSQMQVMRHALSEEKHAFVMEDDLVFCDDFHKRLSVIQEFTQNNEWDVFWLGGTYHLEPTWHKSVNGVHTHSDLRMCKCNLNKDWEKVTDNIVRTYGCWSTYAYIVNKDSLSKVIELLDINMYRSMGIDWTFILLQPELRTFAFNPGCVKQIDNQSNIGKGITRFSTFSNLGPHWFQSKL